MATRLPTTTSRGLHRVVVTGFGAITCLGLDAASSWNGLVAGRSGIRRISTFDLTGFDVTIAGQIIGFDPVARLGREWAWLGDRFAQIGLAAALEALHHAGLDPDRGDTTAAAVVISNAHGNLHPWGDSFWNLVKDHGFRFDDYTTFPQLLTQRFAAESNGCPVEQDVIRRMWYDFPTCLIASRLHAAGPRFTVSSACVSGAKAVERATRWLRRGHAPLAVVGGTEAVVDQHGVWFLNAMQALTSHCDVPEAASKPFDRHRSGFVLAEGAGILILETLEHALARRAPIYAEVIGVGGSANAHSLYAPEPVGEGPSASMSAAIRDARINPSDVDCIYAHATATDVGDPAEAEGVKMTFGSHAPKVALTATKSMIGHAIGASGAIGAINCVQSILTGLVPPVINLTDPDPSIDGLRVIRGTAEKRPIRCALNNAFGFGGTNGSNIFRRFDH